MVYPDVPLAIAGSSMTQCCCYYYLARMIWLNVRYTGSQR